MEDVFVSGIAAERPSRYQALDRELDRLIADGRSVAASEAELAPLVDAAERIRLGLPLVAPGPLFEQRLAALLAALRRAESWDVGGGRHRRLIAGAIGSVAVSVAGVTAVAVWRAAHRHS
ncbi:MAG: hypothetical protein ABR509_07855 [Candidatus Limnocylindria bacterium]